jgi:alpha-L-glutamate ligase-like protein
MAEIVYGTFSKDRPDVAMVEERIVAHPLLDGVARAGLPDIRVIVLDGRARMAMLRLATARSGGRANLHRGGVGVAVDLETGETLRAVQGGRPIERHPDTGVPLVGLQIPSWADVVRTAELSSHAVPHGFLGVDVVVDHTGRALVLEINVRPGLEIQNVHGVGLGAMLGGAET